MASHSTKEYLLYKNLLFVHFPQESNPSFLSGLTWKPPPPKII